MSEKCQEPASTHPFDDVADRPFDDLEKLSNIAKDCREQQLTTEILVRKDLFVALTLATLLSATQPR